MTQRIDGGHARVGGMIVCWVFSVFMCEGMFIKRYKGKKDE